MQQFGTQKLNTSGRLSLGIDIGSTTAKVVLLRDGDVLYVRYERHFSMVRQKTLELVERLAPFIGDEAFSVAISGSAGLGVANAASLPFVQEVFATGEAIKQLRGDTDVVVELGGEDAKVIFFSGGMDERMNGSCAGGTGAFIDQMATLMDMTVEELDKLSLSHRRIYPIASRCGVFAKTDIQPLLNQGAAKADVAASIFQAVVDQTIAGLAQGRKIEGTVMFLGGPLYFCEGLRRRFQETLKLDNEHALFPEYGRYAVAIGAALYAASQRETFKYRELVHALNSSVETKGAASHLPPLFRDEEEYSRFSQRHSRADAPRISPEEYSGKAYLGVDCGSTTTKLVLMAEGGEILYSYYSSNKGNPVEVIRAQLSEIYRVCGESIHIMGSAVTGYGEELIKSAFNMDSGIVETLAHFTAAKHFSPNVDFILDIGGQDIKCFKIKNGAIDSILLNEACSSGCGSFIETFAHSLGYGIEEFSKLALYSKAPVDLGSRCTVFMNSSVKQAQKDGATVEDISAGLSMSVVRNAIYKVIRASSAKALGENIVVQGGTFLNDSVLRSFEMELCHDVVRPGIAGLMGAYGAALYAREHSSGMSGLISREELDGFVHTSATAVCKLCGNRCHLTINTFSGGARFISGNKCEKGAGIKTAGDKLPNMFEYKCDKLTALDGGGGTRGTIGLPLALGMYELAPFWHGIFTNLGFRVVLSGLSTRDYYRKGQYSIPSDTACYPAKIMHGHMETLIQENVDAIFYPCLTYNFDEGISDNHYNCPVVAYYPELLSANMESLKKTEFIYPYLNINDKKRLAEGLCASLKSRFGRISRREMARAVDAGYSAYEEWMADIRRAGDEATAIARERGSRIMILAGRPYHIDPQICHGIDKLANSLGLAVLSEDSISAMSRPERIDVLNQWTYHARLYNAAEYAAAHEDTELVQLVSFGCGLDAITTDEVRALLERSGKLYTQIKIDEITNLGAVKIRLRSLLGAIDERKDGPA